MVVVPAGSLSLAQEALRVTVADTAAFRALVEASDRAAALGHLYHEGLPAPANGTEFTRDEFEGLRPWGIVMMPDSRSFRRSRVSTGGFRSGGMARLRLCRNCAQVTDDRPTSDAMLEWKNFVGQLMAELCDFAIAGDTEHLSFDDIVLEEPPFASAPELAAAQGVWQGAELSVTWGGQ